MKQIDK